MKNVKHLVITMGIAGCVLLTSAQVKAETPVNDKVFGLGVVLGDPSGLTGKFMPTEKLGIQFYAGGGNWWYWSRMFITGIDVVAHPTVIYEWNTVLLNWTIGGGVGVGIFNGHNDYWDDYHYVDGQTYATLIVRMVTGVNLWFKKFSLECFVELNPGLNLIHNPESHAGPFHVYWTAAGARWYF